MIVIISFLTAIASVAACCVIGYFFSDLKEPKWGALLLGIFMLVCTAGLLRWGIEFSNKERSKPVVISTATLPKIDTTITISNGVADTVYTYHIIKKI